MWMGRLTQVLGIGLIVAAFGQYGSANNVWINLAAGIVVSGLGLLARRLRPKLGKVIALLGLVLVVVALVPPFMVQFRQVWIDGLAGLAVWICGWRLVAGESGGPWRLKDRPVF